ncbi:peptide chain release factor 2 [Peredibacter starrii]|uniref:peptide chain release factor 2 n=1 Tax=Peredibacter starrii TaxID=28202 RepID=UPI00389AB02E
MDDSLFLKLADYKSQFSEIKATLETIRGRFDVDRKQNRLKEISELEALDGFWNDSTNATKIQKERSLIEEVIKLYSNVKTLADDFEVLCEMSDAGDASSAQEALDLFPKLQTALSEAEKKALLAGETDPNNAIVTINAGAGGTESCDWAGMLLRMVQRWCEAHGFKATVTDFQYGDSAGIKSATLMVQGNYAYGLLKSESGVHRLVRISPFDSNARRHTSFSSIFVSAEIDDSIEIEVLDKDLRVDIYRSGGAGGQSVNTADSAVRLTHFPTGIVVACQNERSQIQNRAMAMKILKSRLYDYEMKKRQEAQDKIEAGKKDIAWGSQIRSYVLHPYKLVKDHRTGFTSSQAETVLEGDLDEFMKAYLQWKSLGGEVQDTGTDDL